MYVCIHLTSVMWFVKWCSRARPCSTGVQLVTLYTFDQFRCKSFWRGRGTLKLKETQHKVQPTVESMRKKIKNSLSRIEFDFIYPEASIVGMCQACQTEKHTAVLITGASHYSRPPWCVNNERIHDDLRGPFIEEVMILSHSKEF